VIELLAGGDRATINVAIGMELEQDRTTAEAQHARRDERVVDAGLEYMPGIPVTVRVVHRPPRIAIDDRGAAVALAGRPAGWPAVADSLARELSVNVSRRGIVGLPVVRVGPPERVVARRIAEASLALFQELLELSA
jgi:hypothetical protein